MFASALPTPAPKPEPAAEPAVVTDPPVARTTFPGPATVRLGGNGDNATTILPSRPRLPALPPLRPRTSAVPPPVRPALPTFTVTYFPNPTGSGNAQLTGHSDRLAVDSPVFTSSAEVRATGNVAGWRIGYIQTIFIHFLRDEYVRTNAEWNVPTPIRDADAPNAGTVPAPWYSSSSNRPALRGGAPAFVGMIDRPWHVSPWNDPRINAPNSLVRTSRRLMLVAWLVAHNQAINHTVFLKNVRWEINFIVNVDRSQPFASRGTNVGPGMSAPVVGEGQGNLAPTMTGPIYNEIVVSPGSRSLTRAGSTLSSAQSRPALDTASPSIRLNNSVGGASTTHHIGAAQASGARTLPPAVQLGTPEAPRGADEEAPRRRGFLGLPTLEDILDGLAELAANFPGFTLLTLIIGRNPINLRRVERNFTNLLRAFMGFVPFVGEQLFQVLNRQGIVQRMGSWVGEQVSALGLTFEYLRGRFTAFTSSLGLRDLLSPSRVWQRAVSIFTEPVNRIRTFVSRLTDQAIVWLKETFMQPLSNFCREIRGYTLVTVLLGHDPFTNAPVDRSALNVVRAFAEFIPGGPEKVNQLVQSGALQRAYAWFVQETRTRNLTWARVTGTFAAVWNSLRLEDVVHPIDTLRRIVGMFRPLMSDLVGFAGSALMKLLELIFEAAMGAGGNRILQILRRGRDTFFTIIRDPVAFLRHLVRGVGQGVRQFMTNILGHLQQGVIAWLTGPVARAGIQMPERWDLRGVIWFVLQILGLTWPRVREKLVRLMGNQVVAALETGFQLIQEIRERGLVQALRDRVDQFFGQLREAALGSIRAFIERQLVRAGIQQLLSLLTPVGAVIQAIIKTYETVRFFIDRARQIAEFVGSIVDSVAAIAAGNINAAANFIERTMARTIPIILDFLARMIGLGDVGAHVQRTIQSLQARVDQMLDRAVEWIRTMAQRVVRGTANLARRAFSWLFARRSFTAPNGESHTLYIEEQGNQPVLMIRTSPKAIRVFLNDYVTARGGLSSLPAAKQALVTQALNLANTQIAPVLAAIKTAANAGATDAALQPQRQTLLGHYVTLGNVLSQLIGSDTTLAAMTTRYRLEGLAGTFGSMPQIVDDQMTPDHQPQAAVLEWLAGLTPPHHTHFNTALRMQARAAARAHQGYAINLSAVRHRAGRTYGSKGRQKKNQFIGVCTTAMAGKPSLTTKRAEAIRLLRIELEADANEIHNQVVLKPLTDPVWNDINTLSLTQAEKQTLYNNIKIRITRSESLMRAQDLDSLKQ